MLRPLQIPRLWLLQVRTRLGNWWRRLPPGRQDRFAMLAPLTAVILFLAAILAVFSYLRLEETERELEALKHDVEYVQQQLRLRLVEREEQLMRLGRELAAHELDAENFEARSTSLIAQYPELSGVRWIDEQKRIRASVHNPDLPEIDTHDAGNVIDTEATLNNFELARSLRHALFVQPTAPHGKTPPLELHIPLIFRGRFTGMVQADFSLENLYRHGVSEEINSRHSFSLTDANGNHLAGALPPRRNPAITLLPWGKPVNEYEVPVMPVGNGLLLHARAYRTSLGVIGSGLFWLVITLSAMTAWMLIGNWRHTQRRVQAQKALLAETNFRRAMENSMPTGMRALDLQGRITYVNAAFCRMTGWSENELVGRSAPFPYWPEEDYVSLNEMLQDELHGRVGANGLQARIKRKNGSLFDARVYISPLIDAQGQQTGWMTSITDITEPNRVREQLSASHERFTKVLEAIDASVSVSPLGSDELLFANKMYRLWFSDDINGHLRMVISQDLPVALAPAQETPTGTLGLGIGDLPATETGSSEIYIDEIGLWLEVRTRYLTWVDGRLAQMVIATNISPRRQAEEQAATQADRAQTASRLITMGEMASSVAHELNQPLTAINNYCNGLISRIQGGKISQKDLLGALKKTAHQAQRAGQIIHRIRAFVKRSEPHRTRSEVAALVHEAVELAEIELRRQNVRLVRHIAPTLPDLMVDPILIEQVLINLLKNAAEAISQALRTTEQRVIELTVAPGTAEGKSVIEFSVQDTGKGIAPEVMERLYEAFYTTKAEGLGIGLSLCRSIVESHQGRLRAENLYNGPEVCGCRFSFWIPVTGLPSATHPTQQDSDSLSG